MRLLLALLLLAGTALADNASSHAYLRAALYSGEHKDGRATFKRSRLEIKGSRRAKLRYREVASLSEIPAPSDEELAELRADYERRAGRAKDARTWARIGKWASDRQLEAEARRAYERAIELDPEHEPARRALGQIEDGDAWRPTAEVVAERLKAIDAEDDDARIDLAKLATSHRDREGAYRILREILRRDEYHEDALEAFRPLTSRYRQKVEMILPVKGRWKASEDRTRHHQKKVYAVYALDLMKVDAEGKHYRGKGRKLEDFYCWGAPFYATAAGTVVEVINDKEDNPVGKIPEGAFDDHNGVSIDHGDGEVSWYVHAKKGSIPVSVGDEVEQGQFLGEVGNSGGSAVPHLHYTLVQDGRVSVPWACDDYTMIAPDGTPIPVTRACPREGWIIEAN